MEIKVKNDNDHGGITEKREYSKVYFLENGNYYEVYLRILCPRECSILLSTTISIQEPHQ